MKHVLFIVTSADKIGTGNHPTGYEFSEVADPYFEFAKEGYTIDFASILGGKVPEDGYDPTHTASKEFRESPAFKRLNFSHKLSEVALDAYDAIFFPGGLGPMVDMADNPIVKRAIAMVYESGKVVGAVCHGPIALKGVILSEGQSLIADKKVTSFTKAEEIKKDHQLKDRIPLLLDEALEAEGANFSHAEPFSEHVVVDGKLVTGQNPASAAGVAREMIQLIN